MHQNIKTKDVCACALSFSMKAGFLLHSPAAAQSRHFAESVFETAEQLSAQACPHFIGANP